MQSDDFHPSRWDENLPSGKMCILRIAREGPRNPRNCILVRGRGVWRASFDILSIGSHRMRDAEPFVPGIIRKKITYAECVESLLLQLVARIDCLDIYNVYILS